MTQNHEEKIDKIFSMVSAIKTDVAVIKQININFDDKLHTHEGKIAAIEDVVQEYQIEKAKFGVVSKITLFVIGIVGAILGTAVGGYLTFVLITYTHK